MNSRLSTPTILPRNKILALFSPPTWSTIASATAERVLVASARAIQRPIRQARDTVLSTLNRRTLSVVVGLAALPTLDPISAQTALRARSTISSLVVLVIMIVLPSPESMAVGTSSSGAWTAIVVCQNVG